MPAGGPHENGLKPMSAFAVSGVDGIGILQEKLLPFPWVHTLLAVSLWAFRE